MLARNTKAYKNIKLSGNNKYIDKQESCNTVMVVDKSLLILVEKLEDKSIKDNCN